MDVKSKQLEMSAITTYPLVSRSNKVNVGEHFAAPPRLGGSFADFFDSLPRLLGAESLRSVVDAVVAARRAGRPVVLAIGGHVIKCGLQPVLKALIEADVITAVAMNGSAAIHDFEVSLVGATSEDVGAVLHAGDFGFAEETGGGMNRALKAALPSGIGFGEAIGRCIVANAHPFREYSLLATCVEQGHSGHGACGDRHRHHPPAPGIRRRRHRRDVGPRLPPAGRRWWPI